MLLTMKSILTNAQPYVDNKTLGALAGKDSCQYDYGDGCRCVIGASFNEDQIQRLKNATFKSPSRFIEDKVLPQTANEMPFIDCTQIQSLIKEALPEVEIKPQEAWDISFLQKTHDKACRTNAENQLTEFLALFKSMKVKYLVGE